MFNIVLFQPEIPPNTGNIIRLCANTGCNLHLIEPLGFSMQHKQMRRAGLDYHEYASVKRHANWQAFVNNEQPDMLRLFAFTTRATQSAFSMNYQTGDWLLFGAETRGLSEEVHDCIANEQKIKLPMLAGQRSLNLANAVSVAVYEAWRQVGFAEEISRATENTLHLRQQHPIRGA